MDDLLLETGSLLVLELLGGRTQLGKVRNYLLGVLSLSGSGLSAAERFKNENWVRTLVYVILLVSSRFSLNVSTFFLPGLSFVSTWSQTLA